MKASTAWDTGDPKTQDAWSADDKLADQWGRGDAPEIRYTFGDANITFGQMFVNFGNITNNNQINQSVQTAWSEA